MRMNSMSRIAQLTVWCWLLCSLLMAAGCAPDRQALRRTGPAPLDMAQLQRQFAAGDFAAIDRYVAEQLADKTNPVCRENLITLYSELPATENAGELLQEWSRQNIASPALHTLRGMYFILYAWQARGTGWANTVTPEMKKLFRERLDIARTELAYAYELNPADPNSSAIMLVVERGSNPDSAAMETWFQRAIAADPYHTRAFLSKQTYLYPKWRGSIAETLQFARAGSALGPHNPRLFLLLPNAHNELYWRTDEGERDGYYNAEVWAELLALYQQATARYPDHHLIHNSFARDAVRAGQHAVARREFALVGEVWAPEVWDDAAEFTVAREKANAGN